MPMKILRTFVATAAFAAMVFAPRDALAGGEHFYLPIVLEHLPSEADLIVATCYVQDAVGNTVAGGNVSSPMSGGHFSSTLDMSVRKSAGPTGGAPATYWCRFILSGTLADGNAFSFWSNGAVTTSGWRGTVGTVVRGVRGTLPFYLPVAPGSTPHLDIRGALTAQDAAELSEPGDCPCGCGGNVGNGTSACGATRPQFSLPGAGPTPHGVSTSTAPSPGRQLNVRPDRLAVTRGRDGASVTAPRFEFTGTGAFAH